MRQTLSFVIIAAALFIAAWFAWRESQTLHARANAHERYATLKFDDVDEVVAQYWRGELDRLTRVATAGEGEVDAETMLVRANAVFRASQRAAKTREDQLQQLDAVLQTYANVLKAPVYLGDAAYNYEYIARVREGLSKPRAAALQSPMAASGGDLPAGPTIHGRPGGPPPSSKGEEFQIITPMEYGDRETQPEANPGGKPLRKG